MKETYGFAWFLAVFLVSASVPISYAADRSSITIAIHNSTDTAKDTPAELLLTDPQNRRTGFDATAPFDEAAGVTGIYEIPESNYSIQGIADNTGEGGDEPLYREMYIHAPLPGVYLVQIIGKQTGGYSLFGDFHNSDLTRQDYDVSGFVVAGQTITTSVEFDPAPGAPAPVITKNVTFAGLHNDVTVARQLNQLGDDKFASNLDKNIDLAEKLSGVCNRRKARKDKCEPAIAVLKLFIKRLELANRCDNPADCDEEREWAAFRKEHGRDGDYKDFFRDWDRDDWHKHKKQCKRFVTDEALKIIKDDVQWLIKSLGGKVEDEHGKPGNSKHD